MADAAGREPSDYTVSEQRAYLAGAEAQKIVMDALAKIEGEEFLEFKEALDDLRSLRAEHRDLSGGGPDWSARWEAAWAKANDLFANEDEAADQRRIEDFYG